MDNENNENVAVAEETETVKTYSEEEVLKLVQAESDKRVSQALKTQEKKFQKQLSLSQLDDEARAKAEKDDRIAELEQQLAAFTIEKNKSELKSVLGARGLSAEFADILSITDDLEASQENINKLDKLFKDAVKLEVEKRLAGTTPRGSGNGQSIMDKESFNALSLLEQQKLLSVNPDFYGKFLNY